VATAHGCGNKWGLFASHIPHRVGYQCSAAYRHILIPRVRQRAQPLPRAALRLAPAAPLSRGRSLGGIQGLLRDNHYKLTSSGEAIWCGGRSRREE